MKKIGKAILSLFCAATLFVGVTACNEEVVNAYDIAVKNGFVGTEKEWLESLHGADGKDAADITARDLYEMAKEEGFKGSFLDFCKELGLTVTENNNVDVISKNVMSVVSVNCGFSYTNKGLGGSGISYYTSAGSGVIIDINKQAGNALIVTNYHVAVDLTSNERGASKNICLYGYGALNYFDPQNGDTKGNGMRATYVGGAVEYDIALLKVEGSEYIKNGSLQAATLGESDSVSIGEKVYAIGNPEDMGISVTGGLISVESEYITMEVHNNQIDYRVIRTDAAINAGNSGGGLFDAEGNLIGIVNAKTIGEETDNMGYALPITQVKNLCDNMLDNGGVIKRAMLGVTLDISESTVSKDANGELRLTEKFFVAQAITSEKAAFGKLRYGDVINYIVLNGERTEFTRQYQVNDELLKVRKGDMVTLGIERDGNKMEVEIKFDKDSYFVTYK